MKRIDIQTSSPYSVLLGEGLLEKCGSLIREYADRNGRAARIAVITDDTAGPLYAKSVCSSLEEAGYEPVLYTVPHGEGSKNLAELGRILDFLAESRLTGSDLVTALGGGVIGDMAGFASAVYRRGIRYVQIPTTLLAAVDSSVGGKTGVDLSAGKNLAGAFHQPALVLCSLETLETLPEEVFLSGCAEVIKYGMLGDRELLGDEKLFAHLERFLTDFDREEVISRCIEQKRDIVTVDEFDTGLRRTLNFGHTIGHAAEQLSHYQLMHGMAVSIGMAVLARAAAARGDCSLECAGRIRNLLRRFGLPVRCPYTAEELFPVMCADKKRRGSTISVIIPRQIGGCEIREMSMEELFALTEQGL